MHERDQTKARLLAFDFQRKRAEREAIDQHRRVIGNIAEHRDGPLPRRGAGLRKAAVERFDRHHPAAITESG